MNNEEKMVLLINGKEAVKNMEVKTFRDETYILTDWRAPGELMGGMSGKVYCKTKEEHENKSINCYEWYPSVIGGEFVTESELEEEKRKSAANVEATEEEVKQPLRRRGR